MTANIHPAAGITRWAAALLLAVSFQCIAGGITVDAGGAATSGSGEAAGGSALGTPISPAYNPATNTGTVADSTAPTAVQLQGGNSIAKGVRDI